MYGQKETWKITYYPKELQGGMLGVALVEAIDHSDAMYTFQNQYAGQYHTIRTCEKLLG
jgi:hypothetical protein